MSQPQNPDQPDPQYPASPSGPPFGSSPTQPSGSSYDQPYGSSYNQPYGASYGQPQGQSFDDQPYGSSYGQPQGQSFDDQPYGSSTTQPNGQSYDQPHGRSSYGQPNGQSYDQPHGRSSYDRPVQFPTSHDQSSAQLSGPFGPSAPTPAQPTQFPQYQPHGWTEEQSYAPYPQQPGYGLATPVNPYAPQALAPYGVDPLSGLPYSDKSKLVAGLLQIFLGGLGIGRFYLGNAGMAIAQILVTFLTFGFGALWPLIDGIVLLAGQPRDRAGRPLRS